MQNNSRRSARVKPRQKRQLRFEHLEDRSVLATFTVTNTLDSGVGSLRRAINDANGNLGADTIRFAIGSGQQSIHLASQLPAITSPLLLDATTQPGYAGIPLIELDGGNVANNGFRLLTDHSAIRGFVLNRFGTGILISGVSATNNTVQGNYIGTDLTGSISRPNSGAGVRIEAGASNNTIGGSAPGARNIISGNNGDGIALSDSTTTKNVIAGNYIGTTAAGTTGLGNGQRGVFISGGSHHNFVGTNSDGVADATEGNVISANPWAAVHIFGAGADSNVIAGNLLGTNAAGTAAIPNHDWTVLIENGARFNQVGTDGNDVSDVAERNVISGNGIDGVRISAASENIVAGNFIGTEATGHTALGNGASGVILVNGASRNRVGTDGNGIADEAERNVIAGNAYLGVGIFNAGSNANVIAGNYIGIDVTGTAAVANDHGILVGDGADDNRIGTDGNGIADESERNIISGSHFEGIGVIGSTTDRTAIAGNYIGTNATGTAPLGNAGGISVRFGAQNTRIGTDGSNDDNNAAERNLISGNNGDGIVVQTPEWDATLPAGGVLTSGTMIAGNYIGTDVTGSVSVPNVEGILVQLGATKTRIGTNGDGFLDAGERNVISGNTYNGIALYGEGTDDNVVAGNYIGTDVSGMKALGNGRPGNFGRGIDILGGASFNRIGTDGNGQFDTAERNIIAASEFNGVWIRDSGTNGNIVAGNFIGTDAAGTSKLPNARGIHVQHGASNNRIGGVSDDERNVISGNILEGILISDVGTNNNIVAGNLIGTKSNGFEALGNGGSGVVVAEGAINSTIGGADPGAGNLISGNSSNGVLVYGSGTSNTVVAGNSIGTTADGTQALGNLQHGVLISQGALNTIVGGITAAERNVISGNQFYGVFISDFGTSQNLVQGNYIGTTTDGTQRLGNLLTGVVIDGRATNNTVGGTTPAARNIISANGGFGVAIGSEGTESNVVLGNFIGTDVTGTVGLGNIYQGVQIANAANNVVGGTAPGARNVIADNRSIGIALIGPTATGNRIEGNYIGVQADGSTPLGNGGGAGVTILDAPGNTIGGTTPAARNIISGNDNSGIEILGSHATGNRIQGNFIGLAADGNAVVGNLGTGVVISDAPGNIVGGSEDGAGNVISGNFGSGVYFAGSAATGNVVSGNLIGTDAEGIQAIGNDFGVFFETGPSHNRIGTDGDGANDEGERNIISGNRRDGVYLYGTGTSQNVVAGNYIGTDVNGAISLGNRSGVLVAGGADSNTIGGTAPQSRNIISGNPEAGIVITGLGTNQNAVLGNFIGLDSSGLIPLGNIADGITVELGASSNRIESNVISASRRGNGVYVRGDQTTDNHIAGNYVGTDANGSAAPGFGNGLEAHWPVSDGGWGVIVAWGASNNWVGTDGDGQNDAAERNVISGNAMNGVIINSASHNVVAGNYVGTDRDGITSLPNGGYGIFLLNASVNRIGTDGAGDALSNERKRNVISGNAEGGIGLMDSSDNVVAGNYIGLNAAGCVALGNGDGFEGVLIVGNSSSNRIGASSAATAEVERNIISGNSLAGISLGRTEPIVLPLNGNATERNIIAGNYIGTDASGLIPIPNGQGVLIQEGAAKNVIGSADPALGNLIRGNLGNGVTILDPNSTGNSILANAIFGNSGLGIDQAADGVTLNDSGDQDSGPNNRQNYPDLTVLSQSGTTTTISGVLQSTPGRTFRVEFFASAIRDVSGFREGQTYLGTRDVTSGVPFLVDLTLPVGQPFIRATATDLTTGDTSEFSAVAHTVQITAPSPVTVLQGPAQAIPLGSFSDTDTGAGPWTVTIDWGDGTPGAFFETQVQGSLASETHAYSAAGTFTVSVTVANAHGDANSSTFPVTVRPDADGDGIEDAIDLAPAVFSDEFSDQANGGTTSGFILHRHGQILTVLDAPFPAGIVVTALPQGTQPPAIVKFEDGRGAVVLKAGDQVIGTHGSVIFHVVTGIVEATFTDEADRIVATASLPAGAELTFKPQSVTFSTSAANAQSIAIQFVGAGGQQASAELGAASEIAFKPDSFSFVAASTNHQPIDIVLANGTALSVAPGQAANAGVHIDILNDSVNLDSNGALTVLIFGSVSLNAKLIDVGSVVFAGAHAWQSTLVDADRDGRLDLQLKFRRQDTALDQIYAELLVRDRDADGVLDSTRQTAQISITGELVDHALLSGSDSLTLFLAGKSLRDLLKSMFG